MKMRNVRLLAVGAAVALSAGVVASRAFAAGASSSRLPVSALKIINYYPSDAGWMDMWNDYSHATTVSDFAAIKSLDANTVRIIVQPAAVGFPTVDPAKRADLDDMINVAHADGLSVQLSLFDMWHSYGSQSQSASWLTSLLQGEAGNPTIAVVELQNEMPLSSSALSWAKDLLPLLETVLPGVPRTISEPGTAGADAIATLLSDLPGSDIDAVDVHYYGDPAQAATELSEVKALADGKPVFVGETGTSTYGTAAGAEAQARFYEVMGEITHDLGLPPPAPWMLNDVTRAGGQRLDAYQEYMGLRESDGTWRPAAAVVKDLFSGGVPENWDGNMAAEANGGPDNVLGAWTAFDPRNGRPVVTPGLSYDGGQAMCFSRTGGSVAVEPSVEQSFPVIEPGETFTVTGYVKRAAGTGLERISIAGYNARHDYLGEVNSLPATGSGAWQELSVTAKAPAAVSSVQVNLKAAHESGTACWSDVTITQSAP